MRFVSFKFNEAPSWGIVTESGVIDLGDKAPDLKTFIAQSLPNMKSLAQQPPNYDFAQIVLDPVIPNPAKIIMAAVNYFEEEDDRSSAPQYPLLFLRLAASQIGHNADLTKPLASQKLDYEGELAVIIGAGGRHIPQEEALSHVAGYSIYNDASVRDWQKHSTQFTAGKNFVGTGAFGPWMVTADTLSLGEAGASLITRVNGVETQRTNTSCMIFDIAYLISYISTFTVLEPGDVIVTGTCTGFGASQTPQVFLEVGDVVEIEIEGVGLLRNKVAQE